MNRFSIFFLLLNLLLILTNNSYTNAATINATSCSPTDVQNAINNAANKDTIMLPVCNVSWNKTVIIPTTKGLEIIGAGKTMTKITGSAHPKFLIKASSTNNTFTRISAIGFYNSSSSIAIAVIQPTIWGSRTRGRYRIDHCDFNNSAGLWLSGNAYGVTDNCTFALPDAGTSYYYHLWVDGQTGRQTMSGSSNDMGWQDWEEDIAFGTEYMHVVEDSQFTYTNYVATQNWADGRGGGRVMFRYNILLNGSLPAGHDACTSYRRGFHSVEMYGNTFNSDDNIWSFNMSRGGAWLVYDNVFRAKSLSENSPLYFPNPVYRHPNSNCQSPWNIACDSITEKICIQGLDPCTKDSDCTFIPGDRCVNLDGDPGPYPCRDQFAFTGNDMTSHPVVAWNNKYCLDPTNPLNCTPNKHAPVRWNSNDDPVVKYERDVIDFNTINHTGTCEDGLDNDGDGDTDNTSDTTCLNWWDATNKRKKNYTALAYPHPLTLTGRPDPPENLRIILP